MGGNGCVVCISWGTFHFWVADLVTLEWYNVGVK